MLILRILHNLFGVKSLRRRGAAVGTYDVGIVQGGILRRAQDLHVPDSLPENPGGHAGISDRIASAGGKQADMTSTHRQRRAGIGVVRALRLVDAPTAVCGRQFSAVEDPLHLDMTMGLEAAQILFRHRRKHRLPSCNLRRTKLRRI